MKRLSLLLLLGLTSLNAQDNGIDQPFNFIAPPTGGKFVEWYGKLGRTYFIQISDPSDHLSKWKWAPVIERGNDENISYEVDGTADNGFFRLQYTDQTAADLDNADFDGDGISNIDEITPSSTDGTQTNPLDPDTDHDGLTDKWERDHGLNPTDDGTINPNNGPNGDLDGDGVSNIQEQTDGTDPNNPDSDGDGLTDGEEKEIGSNPNSKQSDNDGVEDGEDADPTDPLVNWPRAPESSYVMIEVEGATENDYAKDLNDKGEVLFSGGIWAGGNWIAKSHDAITGVYPDTVSEAFPNGIPYEVLNEQWDFFNNDRKLLQSALIHPTDGSGVDSYAPCPLFWPALQSSPSLIYETADLWDHPYWNASSLGVTTSGEMLIRATLQSSSTVERIQRFDSSGALIGTMDGTGGYHPAGQWQHGDVTPSGWVASNLYLVATASQPAAYKLGLWNAANNLISLPAEADGWGYPVRLADLPNNKVGLVGGQWPNGIHQGRVFLPDANGDMQYDESMSDKHLQLMAGDGTGMTSDGKLWRNGKLIPLRDLSAKYKELEDAGYSLFPLKANKHGVYLIQAEKTDEAPKVFIATKLEIRGFSTKNDPESVGSVGGKYVFENKRALKQDSTDPTGYKTQAESELKISQWDTVFDYHNNAWQFSDSLFEVNPDIFRIRLPEGTPAPASGKHRFKVWTVDAADVTVDAGATVELDLQNNFYQSQALCLVADETDDAYSVMGKADGALNDHTFRAELGGRVKFEWLTPPGGGPHPVVSVPVPVKKIVTAHGYILQQGDTFPSNAIEVADANSYFEHARKILSSCGVKLNYQVAVVSPNPPGVDFGSGLFGNTTFLNPRWVADHAELDPEPKAVMNDARLNPGADVIPVYFVGYFNDGGAGVTTVKSAMLPADGSYANAVFLNCQALSQSTSSHELTHVLLDAVHDGPNTLWGYYNTNPPWCIWYTSTVFTIPETGIMARKRIMDTMRSRLLKSKFCKDPAP